MKSLVTPLLIILSSAVAAQSKKQLNQTLLLQLEGKKAIYDSLISVKQARDLEISQLKNQLYWKGERYEHSIEEFNNARFALAGNYRLLNEIGFNAESMIKRDDILRSAYPSIKYAFIDFSNEDRKIFELISVEPIENLMDLKIKVQNEILTKKIREYDSIVALNEIVVSEQLKYKTDVLNAIVEFNLVQQKMNSCISDLNVKADQLAYKWFEIKKQKDEESEKVYQEELEEAEKARKRGEMRFIPPQVTSEESETPVLSPVVNKSDFREPELGSYPQMPKQVKYIEIIEEPAEFPGGNVALKEYLKINLQVPEKVKTGEVGGKVYIKFVVTKEGDITQVKVTKGIPDCPECDAEAMRVVQGMPKWIPGKNNGKSVNQWYNLPIAFKAE